MTRIDIISGFLGAGKTTLIKKLLMDALKGQQVVLIENEFGEIGIDGGFLKDAGIEIREMNSGCICCSLVGDFGKALSEVITKYHPDRIIIEPSGVGKLSDVIKAVNDVEKEAGVALNSATTVVDVNKCKMYLRNFGEFFENQVESAGTIILSRTDTEKATPEKIEAAVELLRGLNPTATIITTPVEQLGGKKVLDTMEGAIIRLDEPEEEHEHHHHHDHDDECCHDHEHHHHDHDDECCHDHEHHHHDHDDECCHGHEHHHYDHDDECCHGHEHHHHDHDDECCHGHEHHHDHDDECCHDHEHHHDHDGECGCGHHHHHHADEVFTSWGKETVKTFDQEEMEKILKELSENPDYGVVLRAKGMVSGKDGHWIYFDMVPEEYEIREGAPEYTGRICVIGSKLNEEKLAELFSL